MTDQDARAAFVAFCLDRLDIHRDNIDVTIGDPNAAFFEDGIHQGTVSYLSHTNDEITVKLMLGWGAQEETRTFARRDRWPGSERFEVAVAFHRMAKKQAEAEAALLAEDAQWQHVTIPACAEHGGFNSKTVRLRWVCPKCGGPRGKVYQTLSYDGSQRLGVDGWANPCGHIDYYPDVLKEARANEEAEINKRLEEESWQDLRQRTRALREKEASDQAIEAQRLAAAEEDLDSLLSRDPGEAPEEDTQPGVPLDLGTVQLTPIPQLEFTELLRRLKALKADLEGLGCTVKLTGPDGKEIQA